MSFTCSASDPDGNALYYYWDFGDGQHSHDQNPTHTYRTEGTYTVLLTVSDTMGAKATSTLTITVAVPANKPPVISYFSVCPQEGTAPLTVHCSCSASDPERDTVSYLWDFGDGQTSTAEDPSHTYQASGIYTVTVTVEDSLGAKTIRTASILVYEQGGGDTGFTVTITAEPKKGVAPLTVNFSAVPTPLISGISYSWDFGDSQSGSSRNTTHTYTQPGAFSATVTAQDGSGHSASAHTTILVSGAGRETYETGCVTIEADTMEALAGENHYRFSGNVVLNGFVKCTGTVEVEGTEISSTGDLYIEVAGSSPADNETYYIARGGFTIDANADEQGECYGQITQTADIAFDFFGFPVEFSGVKLFEDHVTVGGELVIPWIDVGGVEITFTISPDGIDFSGKITLPNFELSGFGLSGAYMELDTEKLVWEGGGTLKVPGMGFELGVEIGFLAGVLNLIHVEIGDLNKPILFTPTPPPAPVVYLQKISGGLENIAPDAADPLILSAGAGFTGGPKIELPSLNLLSGALKVAGGEYAILGGDIDLEIDTGGRFTAEGTGYLLNDAFGTFGAFVLILDINKGVYFEGNLYYPPGEDFAILVVTGKGKIDFDFNFQSSLEGKLKAPDIWPIIGGMTFGAAKTYIDNDLISAGVKLGKKICVLGKCADLSIKAAVTFAFADGNFSIAQNWDNIGEVHFDHQMRANIMGSAAVSSAGTQFTVPSGASVVMFRMEAQGNPSFTLEAPDKTVYTPNDEQALWRENTAIGELWCAIPQPQAGVWKATAGTSVKTYTMQMLMENQPPALSITAPDKDAEVEAGKTVAISWEGDDPDSDALISLYYDEDREGENGNTITAGISSSSTKNTYSWDTKGVAPGRYYIYGKIDDGKNVPVFAYSRGAVTIKRSDFPAPSITSAALGPEGLSLAWNAINGADGYRIYYRAVADDNTLEEGSAQAVWGETSSVLNNLDWGRSYKIAVTAFTRDGKESDFSGPLDIKLNNSQGNNSPEIQSLPVTMVRAGETYTYQVDARDQDGDALTYSVTKAPSGMSVNSTGKVSWATDTGDVGLHEVEIVVTDSHGGAESQAFKLQVIAEEEANPGPYVAIRCSGTAGPAPLTITFHATTADINGDTLQYAWDFGDDETGAEQNPSHTFQSKGSYSVTLTVTTDSGLSASKTVFIQVTDKIPLVSPPKVRAQVLGSTVTLSWDEVEGAAGFRLHYGTTQNQAVDLKYFIEI